jgi:very-short-patch-repair endonuclease
VRLPDGIVGQAHTDPILSVRRTPVLRDGPAVRTQADDAVLRIARRQHGAFSRDQAFAAGASARFIDRRLAGGRWLRLDNAVYALVELPPTYLRQLKAAELGSRDAAVAGRAAGALHGLTGFRPVRPEIVVPVDVRGASRLAVVHRYAGVKLTTVKGIRVTTVAQTLFDVAGTVPMWDLERALDDALVSGAVDLAKLDERRAFYVDTRRRGGPRMVALLGERMEDAWEPPESELEAVGAELFAALDGLRLERQVELTWRDGAAGRVDFVDRRHRLVIELDGRRWHTRVADFERDLWRTNEAVSRGYRVLRFTWVHVTSAPDDVLATIRRTVALGQTG